MPSANATPSGTAISVVSTDSRTVWITAACSCGLCSTELVWSVKYQRQEKPCQALWDLPLLKENSTAITIGTSDQTRYSQVKPSRIHGWPHGLRRGRQGRAGRGPRGGAGGRGGAAGRRLGGGVGGRGGRRVGGGGRGHAASRDERLVATT